MLPLEWADVVQPPPGRMFVEVVELPIVRGKIHIPDGFNTHTRSSEAVVLKGAGGYEPEDHVLLYGLAAMKGLQFGPRAERTLYLIHPAQVVARIHAGPEGVDVRPVDGRKERGLGVLADTPEAFDEGDPRGLR